MSSVIITYTCPNLDCGEVELETDVEPDDPAYGADADGNRGIFVRGGINLPDIPEICPSCKLEYDDIQRDEVEKQIVKACDEWEPPEADWDGDYDAWND